MHGLARKARWLLVGTAAAAGTLVAASAPASAATTATFNNGVLTVTGDNADNTVVIRRNAAGQILVNGGAILISGGTPTVANTARIQVFGQGGGDTLRLDEAGGALPRANLFGSSGNDVLTGGSGGDQVFGQGGLDTLEGRGGFDFLFGGTEDDRLTGGDADDQVFGENGADTMIWNPGDDTDLNEGGAGGDIVQVNGGGGAEQFTTTANGTRVRFDRINPAPFAIDIGTSEKLVLNANGGEDSFSATGNLAALIGITVDGGSGNDTMFGSNGADLLLGGDGNDVVDGQQGNDVGFLGAGNDTFEWDPGDANDTVEGQDGTDTMLFNGSNAAETFEAAANGGRLLFTRNIASVVMDTDDVELVDVRSLGGADTLDVNDLSGTDVMRVDADLASTGGAGDLQPDNVVVQATNGDDAVVASGNAAGVSTSGLAAQVNVTGAEAVTDRLTINALAGDDVVEGSDLQTGAIGFTADGGDGNDVLIGGDDDDVLRGGPGDDVLIGGDGTDVLDGGPGDNVVIQLAAGADRVTSATRADDRWVATHVKVAGGKTVVAIGGKQQQLAVTDLTAVVTDAQRLGPRAS
jgi:Ca2+-binding RTX toxin-like protein